MSSAPCWSKSFSKQFRNLNVFIELIELAYINASVSLELPLVILHMTELFQHYGLSTSTWRTTTTKSWLVSSRYFAPWLDVPRLDHVDRLWLKWIVTVWKLIRVCSLLATVHVHLNGVSAAGAPRRNHSAAVPRPGEVAGHMRRGLWFPPFLPSFPATSPSHLFFILLYLSRCLLFIEMWSNPIMRQCQLP